MSSCRQAISIDCMVGALGKEVLAYHSGYGKKQLVSIRQGFRTDESYDFLELGFLLQDSQPQSSV